jgi:hypothetical protein
MADDNQLLIKVNADTSQVGEAFDALAAKTGGLGDVLSAAGTASALSFSALVGVAGLSIKAFGESEAAARKLTLAMQNQGIYTDALFESYQAYADELSKGTGIEKTQITNAQSILQTYVGQTAVTKELTLATLNYAAATGTDLNSAAEKIGRTVGTNLNAFARQGLQLNANATATERLAQTVEFLNTKYAGAAESADKGVGSVKGLNSAFKEMLSTIGSGLAPAFTDLVGGLTRVITDFKEGAPVIGHMIVAAVDIATNAIVHFISFLGDFGDGFIKFASGKFQAGLDQMKNAYSKSNEDFKAIEAAREADVQKTITTQNQEQLAAANERAARQKEFDDNKKALERATNQLILMEAQGASDELIKLKQKEIAVLKQMTSDKSKAELDSLKTLRASIEAEEATANAEEKRREVAFEKDMASAKNKARSQGISDGLKLTKKETADIRKEEMTQKDAEKKVYTDELKERIKAHNTFLQEQIKYGTAYATINEAIHSNEVQGVNRATADLVQLQNSKNATLKQIGKEAAVAQIIIHTAESAMNIFEGFSSIPFIGYALGIAGAAAAIAYGAEQISNVQGAAQGALVSGGVPGRDSVPFMLSPGELVAPKQNFDEVVTGVAQQRGYVTGEQSQQGQQNVGVLISFDGPNAQQVLTARRLEDQALGTYRARTSS